MRYYSEILRRKEWRSKSFVKDRFKLTENQIREAIRQGIVRAKFIPNPHGGASITLIHVGDIETNIEKIRKLPKYSKEERFRKYTYRVRGKLRWELGFRCPRCGKYIALKQGSDIFELFWNGEILAKDLRAAIMIGHYIHSHTGYDYDEELMEYWLNEWIEEWKGGHEDYCIESRELVDEYYIEKAVRMLIEDGMIEGDVDESVKNLVREFLLSPEKATCNIETYEIDFDEEIWPAATD